MNELCERLDKALDFILRNGYAKNYVEVARRLGVPYSTLSMTKTGKRVPTWGMLLDLCDIYPIDFRWLRTGKGSIVGEPREIFLLKRIAELEEELRRLRE